MLKDNFPNHCAWEEPKWTTRMSREEFENNCKHDQGRVNVGVCEDTNLGLYSKAL